MDQLDRYYEELEAEYEVWCKSRGLEAEAETLDPFGAGFSAGYSMGLDRGMELEHEALADLESRDF